MTAMQSSVVQLKPAVTAESTTTTTNRSSSIAGQSSASASSSSSLKRMNLSQNQTTLTNKVNGSNTSTTAETTSTKTAAKTFQDLREKYCHELEYMLCEFQKLESQLLGARNIHTTESAGSKERREKLRAFIVHLQETVQQIELGCSSQTTTTTTNTNTNTLQQQQSNLAVQSSDAPIATTTTTKNEQLTSSTSSSSSDDKNNNNNSVQKLEEHILTNLLPVKVRLKKQLAAQQGAKHNPAGMPVRGVLHKDDTTATNNSPPTITTSTSSSSERQKLLDNNSIKSTSQFGKPLADAGSSLTKKLHGTSLGSVTRTYGHGVGQAQTKADKMKKASSNGSMSDTGTGGGEHNSRLLVGGMALGSEQMVSSVKAASSVHRLILQNPVLIKMSEKEAATAAAATSTSEQAPAATTTATTNVSDEEKPAVATNATTPNTEPAVQTAPAASVAKAPPALPPPPASLPPSAFTGTTTTTTAAAAAATTTNDAVLEKALATKEVVVAQSEKQPPAPPVDVTSANLPPAPPPTLDEASFKEQQLRGKKRKKRKHQGIDQQTESAKDNNSKKNRPNHRTSKKQRSSSAAMAKQQQQRGPRSVEYMCALCNEVYNSTCDCNPWWALTQHDCPKCKKMQIPRVDISAPANAIEYHPALLSHAEEGVNGGMVTDLQLAPPTSLLKSSSSDDRGDALDSDLSDDEDEEMASGGGGESDDCEEEDDEDDGELAESSSLVSSSDNEAALAGLSPAEQAEMERFGIEYKGPKLSDDQAAKLLILMLHASTCQCRHLNEDHREVCLSTKWMMLHVRDCPGTTSTFDVCPFPWCRKVKHLLYHLVACPEPSTCPICSPVYLSSNFDNLRQLNLYRLEGTTTHTTVTTNEESVQQQIEGEAASVTYPTSASPPPQDTTTLQEPNEQSPLPAPVLSELKTASLSMPRLEDLANDVDSDNEAIRPDAAFSLNKAASSSVDLDALVRGESVGDMLQHNMEDYVAVRDDNDNIPLQSTTTAQEEDVVEPSMTNHVQQSDVVMKDASSEIDIVSEATAMTTLVEKVTQQQLGQSGQDEKKAEDPLMTSGCDDTNTTKKPSEMLLLSQSSSNAMAMESLSREKPEPLDTQQGNASVTETVSAVPSDRGESTVSTTVNNDQSFQDVSDKNDKSKVSGEREMESQPCTRISSLDGEQMPSEACPAKEITQQTSVADTDKSSTCKKASGAPPKDSASSFLSPRTSNDLPENDERDVPPKGPSQAELIAHNSKSNTSISGQSSSEATQVAQAPPLDGTVRGIQVADVAVPSEPTTGICETGDGGDDNMKTHDNCKALPSSNKPATEAERTYDSTGANSSVSTGTSNSLPRKATEEGKTHISMSDGIKDLATAAIADVKQTDMVETDSGKAFSALPKPKPIEVAGPRALIVPKKGGTQEPKEMIKSSSQSSADAEAYSTVPTAAATVPLVPSPAISKTATTNKEPDKSHSSGKPVLKVVRSESSCRLGSTDVPALPDSSSSSDVVS